MMLKPVGAALRNYASPIFVRDNPMLIAAAGMVATTVAGAPKAAALVAAGGIHALFLHQSLFLFFWWYVAFYIPACFTLHYWREVGSNLATAIPGLRTAELLAITIALSLLTPLFAAPLIWLGAPITGALALAAIAMAGGGAFSAGGPTGQAKGIARARMLLFVPMILVGSQPQYLGYILFAPAPVALALAGLALALTVSGLRYLPARAASQIEANEHRADLASNTPRTGPVSAARHAIGRLMTWKPAFMPIQPLPIVLGVPLGPIGLAIVTCVQITIFLLYMPSFAWITGHGFITTLHQVAPQTIAFGVAVSLFGSGRWLLNRGDWPTLYMAGRYGGRTGYATAMGRAFRTNVIEIGVINTTVVVCLALALGIVTPLHAIPIALCSIAVIFGAGHLPALPLLWHEFGGKGFTLMFSLASVYATMAILGFGLLDHGPRLWAIACAAVLLGLGLAMARIAPRRLAAMDWPIETESA